MAKAAYIVTDMGLTPHFDDGLENMEFSSEAKALKAAKEKLKNGCEDEVWIWRLSHVVSRPDTEPDVEKV